MLTYGHNQRNNLIYEIKCSKRDYCSLFLSTLVFIFITDVRRQNYCIIHIKT